MSSSPPTSRPPSLPSSPPSNQRRLSNRPSPLNPASPATTPLALPVSPLVSSSSSLVLQAPAVPAPPALDRQKSRARDLLRKHYGLGVGPPVPLPGRAADPMDLGAYQLTPRGAPSVLTGRVVTVDSSAFDAKAYYEQLITTSSLPGLLKRENELLTGARVDLAPGTFLTRLVR